MFWGCIIYVVVTLKLEESLMKTFEAMENGIPTFSRVCCGEMLKIYCCLEWNRI